MRICRRNMQKEKKNPENNSKGMWTVTVLISNQQNGRRWQIDRINKTEKKNLWPVEVHMATGTFYSPAREDEWSFRSFVIGYSVTLVQVTAV